MCPTPEAPPPTLPLVSPKRFAPLVQQYPPLFNPFSNHADGQLINGPFNDLKIKIKRGGFFFFKLNPF